MSYTKGELVEMALEEIGIASYEYDISPEQIQSGIKKLESMMGMWNVKGVLVEYPISKESFVSPDDDSNIPDSAWEAVATNLAIRLAPSYGKQVAVETKVTAKQSYNALLGISTMPKEMQFPSMPKGAGYKTTEFRFTPEPKDQYLKPVDEEFDPSGGLENGT